MRVVVWLAVLLALAGVVAGDSADTDAASQSHSLSHVTSTTAKRSVLHSFAARRHQLQLAREHAGVAADADASAQWAGVNEKEYAELRSKWAYSRDQPLALGTLFLGLKYPDPNERKKYDPPACDATPQGFCVDSSYPMYDLWGRVTAVSFRAGWHNSASEGGNHIKPVMCAQLNAGSSSCLGGTGAWPLLVSGHLVNHKLGGGHAFVDRNPFNFMLQDARYNVYPSGWTHAEHVMKRIQRLSADYKRAVETKTVVPDATKPDPAKCAAHAIITLEYAHKDSDLFAARGAAVLPETKAGLFSTPAVVLFSSSEDDSVMPEGNSYMPTGGQYKITAAPDAMYLYLLDTFNRCVQNENADRLWTEMAVMRVQYQTDKAVDAMNGLSDEEYMAELKAASEARAEARRLAREAAEAKKTEEQKTAERRKRRRRAVGFKYPDPTKRKSKVSALQVAKDAADGDAKFDPTADDDSDVHGPCWYHLTAIANWNKALKAYVTKARADAETKGANPAAVNAAGDAAVNELLGSVKKWQYNIRWNQYWLNRGKGLFSNPSVDPWVSEVASYCDSPDGPHTFEELTGIPFPMRCSDAEDPAAQVPTILVWARSTAGLTASPLFKVLTTKFKL